MSQRRAPQSNRTPTTPPRSRRVRGFNTWLVFACLVCCLVGFAAWRLVWAPDALLRTDPQTALDWNPLHYSALRADPRLRPPGTTVITGAPTITAARIDEILRLYNSPAQGTGATWIAEGVATGIDPVYALAFFMHESNLGTNPAWSGWKDDGTTTHNIGNIVCAEYSTCYGRFRDYVDWETGIHDWFRLVRSEYIDDRGLDTVEGIVPIYAPETENDVAAYIADVRSYAAQWSQP